MEGKETSTNSMATIFAWTGALRKRGEFDGNSELISFADRLERAAKYTIEVEGTMTGDLYLLSEAENKHRVGTEEFIKAVKNNFDLSMGEK
jgi:isocitrate dehydrogenase